MFNMRHSTRNSWCTVAGLSSPRSMKPAVVLTRTRSRSRLRKYSSVPSAEEFPARVARARESLPLPALLSQSLLTFQLEFDRESPAPQVHCANTLRVLGENHTIPESHNGANAV